MMEQSHKPHYSQKFHWKVICGIQEEKTVTSETCFCSSTLLHLSKMGDILETPQVTVYHFNVLQGQ